MKELNQIHTGKLDQLKTHFYMLNLIDKCVIVFHCVSLLTETAARFQILIYFIVSSIKYIPV